jgi:UDP-N-acetylglucosamine--N-acetylmuramyl-(pentapeptide) pyrophosphoryl-undecaprenol N-acetylglucosamine transferase
MVAALPDMAGRPGLKIVHQTGREEEHQVAAAYEKAGIQAEVKVFFNNMAEQYQQADLIVCRAGATTVAEITTVGRAAIFVPYPFAADDHQTWNARALVEAGAAEMIPEAELDGAILSEKILSLMDDRDRLTDMAAKALSLGRPDATLTIIGDLYKLIGG